MKQLILDWVPPILRYRVSRLLGKANRYTGPYSTWAEAQENAEGYDADIIFSRAREACETVQHGKACFERDGVVFKQPQYNFPLLCALQRIALNNNGELSVLDFGGSLASTYFQHRDQLRDIRLRWCVVDQPRYVEYGRKHLQSDVLCFHDNFSTGIQNELPNVVLLSSVLQYLLDPYELLNDIGRRTIKYLLIDRTPLIPGNEDRILVQHVPKHVCPVSYPVWFLGYERLHRHLSPNFQQLINWESFDGIAEGAGLRAVHYGTLYVRDGTGQDGTNLYPNEDCLAESR